MVMGFVKSTSIRWKASGHCYALGYDHIEEFLKPNCLSIWDFLSLFTTSENSVAIIVRVPSSLDPWNPWRAIVFNVGTHLYAPTNHFYPFFCLLESATRKDSTNWVKAVCNCVPGSVATHPWLVSCLTSKCRWAPRWERGLKNLKIISSFVLWFEKGLKNLIVIRNCYLS